MSLGRSIGARPPCAAGPSSSTPAAALSDDDTDTNGDAAQAGVRMGVGGHTGDGPCRMPPPAPPPPAPPRDPGVKLAKLSSPSNADGSGRGRGVAPSGGLAAPPAPRRLAPRPRCPRPTLDGVPNPPPPAPPPRALIPPMPPPPPPRTPDAAEHAAPLHALAVLAGVPLRCARTVRAVGVPGPATPASVLLLWTPRPRADDARGGGAAWRRRRAWDGGVMDRAGLPSIRILRNSASHSHEAETLLWLLLLPRGDTMGSVVEDRPPTIPARDRGVLGWHPEGGEGFKNRR